jgi:hypothetical protein
MDNDLSGVALTNTVMLFVMLCPSVNDIPRADTASVRRAEITAATLAIVIGGGLAMLTRKPGPLYVAVFASATVAAGVEWMLRKEL